MYYHVETAYRQSCATGSARHVLIYLCHRADETGQCWPSQRTIADAVGVSRRTVINALAELQELGEVAVIGGGLGRGNVTTYQIKGEIGDVKGEMVAYKGEMVAPFTNGADPLKGENSAQKGETVAQKGEILATVNTNKRKEKDLYDPAPLEIEPPPDPERDAINTLAEEFQSRWRVAIPRSEKTYTDVWQSPLMQMLDICGGDVDAAREFMDRVFEYWKTHPAKDGELYGVKGPSSLTWLFPKVLHQPQPAGATSAYGDLDYGTL